MTICKNESHAHKSTKDMKIILKKVTHPNAHLY